MGEEHRPTGRAHQRSRQGKSVGGGEEREAMAVAGGGCCCCFSVWSSGLLARGRQAGSPRCADVQIKGEGGSKAAVPPWAMGLPPLPYT